MLVCSSASAINLSQLKLKDICYSPTYLIIPNNVPYAERLPDVDVKSTVSDLSTLGIAEGTPSGCKWQLYGRMEYNKSGIVVDIISYLYLNEANKSSLDVTKNGYININIITYVSAVDSYQKAIVTIKSLYDLFVTDWKQAHP